MRKQIIMIGIISITLIGTMFIVIKKQFNTNNKTNIENTNIKNDIKNIKQQAKNIAEQIKQLKENCKKTKENIRKDLGLNGNFSISVCEDINRIKFQEIKIKDNKVKIKEY